MTARGGDALCACVGGEQHSRLANARHQRFGNARDLSTDLDFALLLFTNWLMIFCTLCKN
jgi:hypothetical protein